VTRLELRRRLDDRLRETSADLWPAVGERKQVVDRVSRGYRADATKHRWLVHEQTDLYAGEPVYVVHRALSKVFQDPLKARAEAVKDALNSIEHGAG
jgi:hypothetical protein